MNEQKYKIDKQLRFTAFYYSKLSKLTRLSFFQIPKVQRAITTTVFLSKLNEIRYCSAYIKRSDGTKLRLAIFMPKSNVEKMPGIVWLHGGGFTTGVPNRMTLLGNVILEKCLKITYHNMQHLLEQLI